MISMKPKMQEINVTDRFTYLLDKLKYSSNAEQKQIIEEMNELIDDMGEVETEIVFTTELFDKIELMIEEKNLSLEDSILLLKRVGRCSMLKLVTNYSFVNCSLRKRFEKLIIDEDKKKEGEDQKLLIDLCECYLMLIVSFKNVSKEMISVLIPCIMKVALYKEENEETQKEVEMALLALSYVEKYDEIEKELFLKDIKEIITNHQKRNNLTRFAYQAAWQFLIYRLCRDESLEDIIVNELHFGREARRELEELSRSVDWKRNYEEKGEKEAKDALIIKRWLQTFESYLESCELWNEEYVEVFNSIVQVLSSAKVNNREISYGCIHLFMTAAENSFIKIEDLLKSGAADAVMEGIHQPTMDNDIICMYLEFFEIISLRLKEKKDDEIEEAKRKELKKKVFEKMEEVGDEDAIMSFYKILPFLASIKYFFVSSNIKYYFVNV